MYEPIANVFVDGSVAPIPTVYMDFIQYDELNSGYPVQTSGVARLKNGKVGYVKLTMDGARYFHSLDGDYISPYQSEIVRDALKAL